MRPSDPCAELSPVVGRGKARSFVLLAWRTGTARCSGVSSVLRLFCVCWTSLLLASLVQGGFGGSIPPIVCLRWGRLIHGGVRKYIA